jgi:hypothetical protein
MKKKREFEIICTEKLGMSKERSEIYGDIRGEKKN